MKANSLLAIIAAAGIGKRFDGDLPKQYVKINGRSIIENAVKGMLPKNKLGKSIIKKLKVYSGSEHPHESQNPSEWNPKI